MAGPPIMPSLDSFPPEYLEENEGPITMAVVLSTLGVATVAIALRFYTRVAIVRNFWPEDWTLAASWLFSVGLAAASVVQVKHGAGRHIIVLPYPIIVQQLKALYATLILYGFAINLVKISILLQIRRVFPQKFIRRSSLVLMIITFIVAIVGLSLQIFECNPIPKAYNPMLPGKCIPHIISWFTGASLNMLLDIAIFLLPLPPLRKLKIPRRQKVTLYLVFCLGFSVCIVSVVRLPSLHKLSISRDPTYDNATTLYLTFIEVNVAIICASIPPLKALVKRYMPLLLGVISDAKSSVRPIPTDHNSNDRSTKNKTDMTLGTSQSLLERKPSCDHGPVQMFTVFEADLEHDR